MFSHSICSVALFILNIFVVPVHGTAAPTVSLPYGKFQGLTSAKITSYLGIPFARPPVGNLRFAPPQPPLAFKGIRNATSFGSACPQQNFTLPGLPGPETAGSEDCLFLNVFAPSSIAPGRLLPVVFWLYGGGFEDGDSATNPGDTIVNRSISLGNPVIYVSANYRLNAFGFLGGKEVKAAGIGNAGLRDQRFAMEWIQKYIREFGGDSAKVTLWGQSAGAVSIGLHMVVNNGRTNGLFRGAFMQSGSPPFLSDITTGQQYYDQLIINTGCTNASDTLACLRSVSADVLLNAVNVSPNLFSYQSMRLAWMPSVDGVFLTGNPQDSVADGNFAMLPLISGDCDDEGTLFSLSTLNITTNEEFLNYVHSNYLPDASDGDIRAVGMAYPDDVTKGPPFDTGPENALTPEYKRLSAFGGDYFFQGPRRFFLRAVAETQDVWAFLYKRGKTANGPLGAFHASDIPEFYGSGNADFIGTDALINFINNLNPNDHSLHNQSLLSAIAWPKWGTSSGSPPLLAFTDPAPNVSIISDTFRFEEMNLVIDLARKFP
ncbi:carotenoid ester lipase precursor [Rickenella mellea]|uniref:Carboxylic ester hydrolase n=1 Tax=Rickenella mellea TaxID=50990 RepID=A0A4Y7PHL8_9AGAM|nr:carotenoid ester lipase precursor [Rickenella mellea]